MELKVRLELKWISQLEPVLVELANGTRSELLLEHIQVLVLQRELKVKTISETETWSEITTGTSTTLV